MRRDHRLSRMLHVLIHLDEQDAPLASTAISGMLGTPAPIVRRMMSALRGQGIVASAKGHGGGWTLERPLDRITMLDIYEALGEPTLFAVGPVNDDPVCLAERAVDARLGRAFAAATDRLRAELRATTLAQIAEDYRARLAESGLAKCEEGPGPARG
ncbi:MAG: Rrf2 family transcriptional regulator [Pseudomonadota bacterium]